ncbi:septum formation initiator family protein [Sphingomonas sp. PL-96]|uniref:FtsB family cell division protein n=1 Tax=Sphingomonas sp. PL-96 TaxID=2887201 RepID=UPI001E42FAD2|nr:septum formation initiator family protein [Sphingomonas sp. PL-96]MCC2976708.1 septum formation initiator family protein [Sphingomonas sp. PL-96]
MPRTSPLHHMLRRAGFPAFAILFMGFFGYYAVLGPNGVLAYRDYSRKLAQRQAYYACLDKARAELRNRVALLDPRHADPDMVDELVRKQLNVAHPDEYIMPLGGDGSGADRCSGTVDG